VWSLKRNPPHVKLLRETIFLALAFCGWLMAQQTHRASDYCAACQRDSRGHIKRSASARHAFRKAHPCPATGSVRGPCDGYAIDHIRALKHGGADDPSNMQWETRAEAKAKDRTE